MPLPIKVVAYIAICSIKQTRISRYIGGGGLAYIHIYIYMYVYMYICINIYMYIQGIQRVYKDARAKGPIQGPMVST